MSSTSLAQPVPREYNAFAYVIEGQGSFGEVMIFPVAGLIVVI